MLVTGMIVGTVFTLFVVPAIYTIVARRRERARAGWGYRCRYAAISRGPALSLAGTEWDLVMTYKFIPILAFMSLLAACTTGAGYRRPAVPTPATFRGAANTASDASTSLADLKWFEVFKDEQLRELIRTAHVKNFEIQDAVARIAAADANLGITRADRLPSVGFTVDHTAMRFSRGGSFPVPDGFQPEADIWLVGVQSAHSRLTSGSASAHRCR